MRWPRLSSREEKLGAWPVQRTERGLHDVIDLRIGALGLCFDLKPLIRGDLPIVLGLGELALVGADQLVRSTNTEHDGL